MDKYFYILWISALLLPFAGFILFKLSILKKTRVAINCMVLLVAFLFNLMKISFQSDILDIVFLFIVIMTFMKFTWSALKMKVNVFKYSMFIAGSLIFLIQFGEWFAVGPNKVFEKRFPVAIEHFSNKINKYKVKEFKCSDSSDIKRSFTFLKSWPFPFLEKELDNYVVPNGYNKAIFSFKLNQYNENEIALIGDNDTLWTLKGEK